jgi:hypothetical protein
MKLLFDECVSMKVKFLFADDGHQMESNSDSPWERTRLPARRSWRRGSHSNPRRRFSGSMIPTIAP